MLRYFPGHTNRLRVVIKHESGKTSFKTGSIEVDVWHGRLYSTTKVQLCRREPLWITAQIRYKSVIFQLKFTIDTHCQWDLTVYCMTQWYRKWTVWLIVHFTCKGAFPYPEPVVSQWQSSGNPVCLERRPQCTLECHWRKIVGSQCVSSGLPVAFQWSSYVFQLCKLTLDRHWNTTGC